MHARHWIFALGLSLGGLASSLAAATAVDINHADAATLAQSLNGVGLAKAEAIVAWRQDHGPYKNLDDLKQVKGIGPALLERNRDQIQFGHSQSGSGARSRKARGH